MALLRCYIKGRYIRLQGDLNGIKKGEYCFVTPYPSVSKEDCLSCQAKDCRYGFNLKPLRKNLALREKVLNYVFDPSLDDELLLEGIVPNRELYLYSGGARGKIYSKPCYNEEIGKVLIAHDEECRKRYDEYLKVETKAKRFLAKAEPLPPRVIKRERKSVEEKK